MNETIINLLNQLSNDQLQINALQTHVTFTTNKIIHKIKFIIDDTNLSFNSADDSNYHTKQLINILNLNFNNINDIFQIPEFIQNTILTNFCVICQKQLDFQSTTYISCGDQKCLYKYEEF